MTATAVESALNLIGLFAFALSGALLAVRQQYDVIGMAILGSATALGGGLIRDVLIGDVPASALRNTWWLIIPLMATAITFFFHPQVARLRRAVQIFDAVGLGLFCAAGATKALAFGLSPLAAVLMGAITGIGGGIIRDLLAGVTPSVLARDSKLYAIPAILGSTAIVIVDQLGANGLLAQFLAAIGITTLRLVALWRGWTAPVPRAAHG